MKTLIERHRDTLEKTLQCCHSRESWSAFVESPSTKIHGKEAPESGLKAFQSLLGKPFQLDLPGEMGRIGSEVSPYTQEPLGIDYPLVNADEICEAATKAMQSWRKTSPEQRAALCIELLRRIESACFEQTYATMHTAGQPFLMGFVGSGANALDRGLEAVGYAYKALVDIPENARWEKPFGKTKVALEKRYHIVPRGIALVFCCASFPAWNAYPAIMANFMTGNPVVLKPHPSAILPMAMVVKKMRDALVAYDIDPNLITLAADTAEAPIAGQFLQRNDVAIIDFTGSQRFGSWLEENVRNKLLYTETSGVNSVIIESSDNPDGMISAIAHSLCLFSSQMCTSPQNIRIPSGGIKTPQGVMSVNDFCQRLVTAVNNKVSTSDLAANLCGALQSQQSTHTLAELTKQTEALGELLRPSEPYSHPDFPQARTATPLIIHVKTNESATLKTEHFAPVAFVIEDTSADESLRRAADDAAQYGAISTHVYSIDNNFLDSAEIQLVDSGASFSCNLTGPMALNFAAAYSDLHVSGLNPAGTACLSDLAFVSQRFHRVQCRWPAGTRG